MRVLRFCMGRGAGGWAMEDSGRREGVRMEQKIGRGAGRYNDGGCAIIKRQWVLSIHSWRCCDEISGVADVHSASLPAISISTRLDGELGSESLSSVLSPCPLNSSAPSLGSTAGTDGPEEQAERADTGGQSLAL